MLRVILCAVLCVALVLLTACATGGDPALRMVTLEFTRAAADVALDGWMEQRGVSEAIRTETIRDLRRFVDALIADQGLDVVLREEWPAVRQQAVRGASGILVRATNLPQPTVEAFAGTLVDAFAARIRQSLSQHQSGQHGDGGR